MSSQVFVPLDDPHGVTGPSLSGHWAALEGGNYFGGQSIYSANGSSITFAFQGVSLALIGSTGPNPYNHTTSQTFQVSIDGTKPYTTSTTDSDPPHYMQWYQSPLLSAGMHTIVLSALSGLAVDYVVITPAPDTLLTGETLMVDDSYEGISYSGNWQTTSNTTFAGGTIFYSHAFQNTSHQTSTVGDSFLFSYTGTNLSVFGIFPYGQVGSLELSYTVDGSSPSSSNFTSPSNPGFGYKPNVLLLETGPLEAGNHTLTVTLTGCVEQTLFIDYILYSPSFDTLSAMPNLTEPTTPLPSSPSFETQHSPVAAIAGGVVASVAIITVLVILIIWYRRRHPYSSADEEPMRYSASTPVNSPIESFSGGSPTIPSSAARRGRLPPLYTDSYPSDFSSAPPISTVTPTSANALLSPQTRMEGSRRDVGSSPVSASGSVDELRRTIQVLRVENDLLASFAMPPAYNTQ